MPRTRRGGSAAPTDASLGRLLATTLPEEEEEEDDEEHYAAGFGTRRGTVCHCSRCLRRSGPLTDDPRQVVEDITDALADMDPEGAATGFSVPPGELEEQHRVLAGALTLAVERGDAEVLRTLLNGIEDYGMQVEVATRLVVPAAQHGHASLIHLLDQFEADLEEPDSARGGPPLMHAANNGHVAAINALLECGAYTESMDFQNQTALMVAVFSDRASSVEALLTGGALVDAEDCRGRTALSHAARYGSLDCIAVLAAHGADVFREDKDGRTPLEIAEDCARFEAAAQLKRFEQRQRLRERKESRAREAAPVPKLDRKQLEEREAQALQHALALVEEVEAEAARKAARKHKAKRNKKKGKAGGEAGAQEAADADSEPEAACSKLAPKGQPGASTPPLPARRGSPKPAAQPAAAVEPAASTSRAASNGAVEPPPAQQAANGSHAAGANGAAAGSVQADPMAEQRAAWDALLEEAAGCRDESRQAALVGEVRAMADRCAAAGISVKYGKKLLGKLERCAGVRRALRAACGGEQLEAAVAQGRGLRSLLDEELLATAEAALRRQQEAAAAAAAKQAEAQRLLLQRQRDAAREAAQQAQRPQPAEWEAAAEAARRLQRLQLERNAQGGPASQQQQQPQPPVPRLANGSPLPVNLNGQPLSSLTPRQPQPHGQPAAAPAQPLPPPQQQQQQQRRQQAPAAGGLQDLFPLPAAGAHMHKQGLANLWQRPQQPAQPPPAVSLGGGGGFFTGSLFESSLPLPRQPQPPPPPPPRPQPPQPHQPQPQQPLQQQQQQQQGAAPWHPFSGPEQVGGGSLGWLDSMLGPSPAPPAPGPLPGFGGGFTPGHAGAGAPGRFAHSGAPLANGGSHGLGSAPDWGQPALPGQPRWS